MTNPLKNARLSLRLLFICISFSLPICVLLFLMVKGVNDNIHFARWETYGNEYQRPLMELLNYLPQHQLAVTQAPTRLLELQTKIDQAFSQLESVHARLGDALEFTAEGLAKRKRDHVKLDTVKKEWSEIKARIAQLSPNAVREKHVHLVSDLRTLITHAGDLSNLILDPDLDSYYLMDATLCALPQMQDRLAAVMTLGLDVLQRATVTQDDRIRLSVAAAMLSEADLDRVRASLDTSLNEDVNFYGVSPTLERNLRLAATDFGTNAEEFIKLTRDLATAEKPVVDATAFLAAGSRAREKTAALWSVGVGELDSLLNIRIKSFQRQRTSQIGWTALALGLALAVVVFITRSITNPLRLVSAQLSAGSDQIESAAGGVSSTSQSMAEGTGDQAASLQETSAALEEIASMTRRNSQNAQSAKEFAAQTRTAAESGVRSTGEMGRAMQGIRTASGEMRDAMNGIKAASNDVSKIIKTIDEIAFQTNILALNAAVEAARAGEAGMGFAVVADEVRNLAQRSAKAAKETADMIEASIKRSEDGVRVTEKVTGAVEDVTERSKQLEGKLAEILAKAHQVDEQVGHIASASQEQSQGISEVNMAVGQMDQITQSNAAGAEEIAGAAEELSSQAASLKGTANVLRQLVGGGEPAAADHPEEPFATVQAIKPTARHRKSAAREVGPKDSRASQGIGIPEKTRPSTGRRLRMPRYSDARTNRRRERNEWVQGFLVETI